MLTYGSLFSGIGGFDLGLDRAGMHCLWQVEIDEYCQRILSKHWPDVPKWRDANTFPDSIANWQTPDVIIGGDPCQANSGAAQASSAASLGDCFLRIVGQFRPRLVVRENPSHVRKNAPWPWWRFRDGLEHMGYAVLPFRLRACCAGAFHQRDRLFVLGHRADANRNRLERRQELSSERRHAESQGFLSAENWLALYAGQGFASRTGISDYVAGMKGVGNAVCPHVAERLGRMLIKHFD